MCVANMITTKSTLYYLNIENNTWDYWGSLNSTLMQLVKCWHSVWIQRPQGYTFSTLPYFPLCCKKHCCVQRSSEDWRVQRGRNWEWRTKMFPSMSTLLKFFGSRNTYRKKKKKKHIWIDSFFTPSLSLVSSPVSIPWHIINSAGTITLTITTITNTKISN